MSNLHDASADMAAMPIGEMGLQQLLAMLDTAAAAVETLAPAADRIGRTLHDQVFMNGRVIEPIALARNDAAQMHTCLTEAAQAGHLFYDAYIEASQTTQAPNRDNLIATQQGG